MKNLFFLSILLFAFSCTPPSNNVIDDNDQEELTDIQKNQFVKAYLEQDTVLLNKLLHEDYQLVDDNGDRYTKQDELTYISNYAPSYSSQENEILEIDIIDNGTAVVLAKVTLKGTEGAEAYITTYISSTSFVKSADQWSAINTHVSGVKEERFPIVDQGSSE